MEEISTDDAPDSIGPFSQAIRSGARIFVSGQGPVDPATGDLCNGDIKAETAQTLDNIDAILTAADSSLDAVVKATIFVQDMNDYDDINHVYRQYMSEPYPARSAIQVEDLPVDIGVEIEVIAETT